MLESWAHWWSSQNLPIIEWWAAGLAVVYVVLAARNNPWCWPLAFGSSLLWAYQVWAVYSLYFDTALNLFYAAMAVVGAWRWWGSRASASTLTDGGPNGGATSAAAIRPMTGREHILMIFGSTGATLVLWVLAKAYTSAALPGIDAATTVVSIGATILLIERKLENWLYLLAADVAYVFVYWERGSAIFALVFVLYCVLAVYGYRSWLQMSRPAAAVRAG